MTELAISANLRVTFEPGTEPGRMTLNALSDFFLSTRDVRDRGPVASWSCVALPSGIHRSDASVLGTLEEGVSEGPKGMCDPTPTLRRLKIR